MAAGRLILNPEGQGGGVGRRLVKLLRPRMGPDRRRLPLGTNAMAGSGAVKTRVPLVSRGVCVAGREDCRPDGYICRAAKEMGL